MSPWRKVLQSTEQSKLQLGLFIKVAKVIQSTSTWTETWANLPHKTHTITVSCCPLNCICSANFFRYTYSLLCWPWSDLKQSGSPHNVWNYHLLFSSNNNFTIFLNCSNFEVYCFFQPVLTRSLCRGHQLGKAAHLGDGPTSVRKQIQTNKQTNNNQGLDDGIKLLAGQRLSSLWEGSL